MKSIARRFERFQRVNPSLSTFINFCIGIEGQRFSRDKIKRNFETLVEKGDYQASDKIRLMEHFLTLTNSFKLAEAYEKQTKFRLGGFHFQEVALTSI